MLGVRIFAGTPNKGTWWSDDEGGTWHPIKYGQYAMDLGAAWTTRRQGMGPLDGVSLAGIGLDLYAATRTQGVYRSFDQGRSWFPLGEGYSHDISSIHLGSRREGRS